MTADASARGHIAALHAQWPDQVRHGRICRNAVYSSAHRPRALDPG